MTPRKSRLTPCPVILAANQAHGAAGELYKALHRYKKLKRQCDQCPRKFDCSAIGEADRAIHDGIQLINDEWNALYDA